MTRRSVGIDVGGTKCLGVALGADGEVLQEHRILTPRDPDQLVAALAEMLADLGATGSAGVCVPGLVTREGVLLAAPNLTSAQHLRVRDRLEERTGLRLAVDNDNTAACLAEWRLGAGRGVDDLVQVGLGTGIGGGFVAGGVLQRGHRGFAGEMGHMVVQADGIPCPCGQRGCWERYASGTGLAHLAQRAATEGRLGSVLDRVGGSSSAIRGEDVTAAARDLDPQALAVIDEYADWVALGLVNLTNVFDPGAIVLSGGLSADAPVFLAPIQEAFTQRLFGHELRPRPEVRMAQLGPQAGAIGAALLARDG